MDVFLYEFVTGGGWRFVEPEVVPHGSLLREGLAMISAVAEDFAAIPGAHVVMLWDDRLPFPTALESMPQCRAEIVRSTSKHDELLAQAAARAESTLLIAPEFDNHLSRASRLVQRVGGRLISPDHDFTQLAADKHNTAEYLRLRGVAAPQGVAIARGELLPHEFQFPAVLKPRYGAGSQGVQLLPQHPRDGYIAPDWMRLEAYIPGQPASVAALCGPAGPVLLPPCTQRLSHDGIFAYQGGQTPLASDLAERARLLAQQTLSALPPTTGYIGIDMVLGERGTSDTVIEVNPRLTTSYIGLRRLVRENLAEAMLQAGRGQPPDLSLRSGRVEFNADGDVSYFESE